MPEPTRPMGRLRGACLLLCGQSAGLAAFGNAPQEVVGGYKPYAWLAAVMSALLLLQGQVLVALVWVMALFCMLTAPLVVMHFLAERFGVAKNWYRYAAASLWCHWVLGLLLSVVMLLIFTYALNNLDIEAVTQRAAQAGGLSGEAAMEELLTRMVEIMQPLAVVSFVYMLWLQWFLARHALGADAGQAALLAVGANVGAGLLMAIPQLGGYL